MALTFVFASQIDAISMVVTKMGTDQAFVDILAQVFIIIFIAFFEI